MLAFPLCPSFFDMNILSMSSLGCKFLYIVINFLVHWSIDMCYSLVHFKNGTKHLTRSLPRYFFL